jgi:hypothetical protein
MADDLEQLLAAELNSLQQENRTREQQQQQQHQAELDANNANNVNAGYDDDDDQVGGASSSGGQQMQQQQQQQPQGVAFDPRGLIPMCVQNPSDPASFRPEIFGYDISRIAERPWAQPGANTSDYFNYGFDEQSWRVYCALQLSGSLSHKSKSDAFLASILQQHALATGGATGGGGMGASPMGNRAGGGFYRPAPTGPAAGAVGAAGGDQGGAGGDASGANAGGDDGSGMMHGGGGGGGGGYRYQQGGGGGGYGGQPHHQPGVSYYKTRLCHSYQATGYCVNGANCKFAHGEADRLPTGLPRPMRGGFSGGAGGAGGGGGAMAPPPQMGYYMHQPDGGGAGGVEDGERAAKRHLPEEGPL